ncbi:1289_t:CDS:2 [Entrophospora sp. SA101]|nr:1289_t:CDS:2 [Entrophospora sp. SA101]
MNFDSSQVFGDVQSETTDANVSTTSSTLTSSLVWEHFDKNPSYALEYNVCKKCTINLNNNHGIVISSLHIPQNLTIS